jgi:hypothetical protein
MLPIGLRGWGRCKDYASREGLIEKTGKTCSNALNRARRAFRGLRPSAGRRRATPQTWEIPGRVFVNLSFRIQIEGPKLRCTHKGMPGLREGVQLYFSIFPEGPGRPQT